MSGLSAHFSFDTFQGHSLKGAFLSSFLAANTEDKPLNIETKCPDVQSGCPGCRSPPALHFVSPQPEQNEMEDKL